MCSCAFLCELNSVFELIHIYPVLFFEGIFRGKERWERWERWERRRNGGRAKEWVMVVNSKETEG